MACFFRILSSHWRSRHNQTAAFKKMHIRSGSYLSWSSRGDRGCSLLLTRTPLTGTFSKDAGGRHDCADHW